MTDQAPTPMPGLTDPVEAPPARHPAVRRLMRQITWPRVSLFLLLAVTAGLYLWNLGASGWANSFYSAAVEAGARSWKAFLFGSFDASNFITVDKPPASLWVMDLFARVFGVNAWSILVPQALEGVAAVGLLYATVRRGFGHAAGLIAGAALALTPIAALMFRFNNPDALLVLLLVGSAYALTRALEAGRTRWLVLAGALVGLGFLTKMMGAFLVLPGFAAVYLLAASVTVRRRLWQLVVAALSVLVAGGWWVALVSLWPAADRPYIGGSTDNSVLNLIFGYNGFGRVTGNETGSVGGGGAAGGNWGPTGLLRMFNDTFGSQASWLIPAALILCGGLLWLRGRAPRTDAKRAAALLWGSWLVITALVFSLAQGIIHPYYTVALAPAIGALLGIGGVELWRRRDRLAARGLLAVALAATAIWAFALLGRSPDWMPWLAPAVLVAGLLTAAALLAPPVKSVAVAALLAGCVLATALAAPTAYALDTVATSHSGAIPTAGPTVISAGGGPGGAGIGAAPGGGVAGLGGTSLRPAGAQAGLPGGAGTGGFPAGGPGGPAAGGSSTGGLLAGLPGNPGTPASGARTGTLPSGVPGAANAGGGGLLNAGTPSAAIKALLEKNASSYRWVVATVGANNAAGYQLATGDATMAIGGFNGTDPWPTLSVFEKLVKEHEIHYFVATGTGGGAGVAGSTESTEITTWVASHFTKVTAGGATLYDLTLPLAATAS